MKSIAMNMSFEFHDSVLKNMQYRDGTVRLIFNPAIIHKSEGECGVDPGEVWSYEVEVLADGVTGPLLEIPPEAQIAEGRLIINKKSIPMLRISPRLPLGSGSLKMQFVGKHESILEFEFSALRVMILDIGKFLEKF